MKRIPLACLVTGLCVFFAANYVQSDSTLTGSNRRVTQGCQTDVLNRVYRGRPISTWIDECSVSARNHVDFVGCVARLARELKKFGLINGKEKGALQKCVAKKPSIILFNAQIYTMEDRPFPAEAVFIVGNRIQAVGTNEKILAMSKKYTLRVDLGGRAVFPGFIDPHTHLFNEALAQGLSLDEAQQLALENGITAVGNMYTDPYWIEEFMQYAEAGNMRLRLYLYLNYNHSCGDVFGTWYEDFVPRVEHAPRVWVNGVKIMAERSVCGGQGVQPVFTPELLNRFTPLGRELWEQNQLHLALDELTAVIQRADDYGYQVAIHAIGDLGIETSLSAISAVRKGSANKYRHMVLHNYFIRDDMLDMYSEGNIVALVEPTSPCHANSYVRRVGEENRGLFKRWRDLVDTGIHVGLNSDWPFLGFGSLDPMRKLYAVVTGNNGFDIFEPDEPCEPLIADQSLSVFEGLKMMTIESAYAMHTEKRLGSIKAGKLADLVVLSHNPFEVDPDDIKTIKALMTMIDGKIEFWSEDLH
ncbi:MAG: amidohydrolase family protein [Desulfobacterales bacterium]|nr:MAG: amidohydrolase family protein [Desulfobacterales bacterium]